MPSDPDLATTVYHAAAALRRKEDTLTALRYGPDQSDERFERAVGDASQGALSIYLALAAATRFCDRYPTPGPLGRTRMAQFLDSATHLRDAVMHWDEKGERDSETGLLVDGRGLVIYAPPGRAGTTSVANGLTWRDYEHIAGSLLRWARHMRELPLDEV